MASAKRPLSASEPHAEATATHLSGLWLGEAVPSEDLKEEFIPNNPITWSLTLLQAKAGGSGGPSAFGGGFFDDCGDVPGSPVLLYTLSGSWEPQTGAVKLTKKYCSHAVPEELAVSYEGHVSVVLPHALVGLHGLRHPNAAHTVRTPISPSSLLARPMK